MAAGLVGTPARVQAALDAGTAALRDAGVESARVEAEWLLAAVLGVPRPALALRAQESLAPADEARFERALRRRVDREPLQHIVGTQPFRHVTLAVSAAALVPRPETEALAGWALDLLRAVPADPVVIDVGTGSGCIACALAFERADLRVIGLDVAPGAVALARANVTGLGLSERVTVEVSDLFAALPDMRVDLIVSNPPYLPTALIDTLAPEVSRHDPRLALDGGPDGLDVIRRLVGEAPAWLAPGGALVLETAGGEQARTVAALMGTHGLVGVETRADLVGVERFVAGRRSSCRHG
jgi:release factor glutamine methyltransferase